MCFSPNIRKQTVFIIREFNLLGNTRCLAMLGCHDLEGYEQKVFFKI